MINPITGNPFNNFNLSNSKDEIYQQQIKKYVDEVVNVITSDLIATFNPHPNATKRYVYTIGNFGAYTLVKHPQLPDTIINNLQCVYKNDIERIYPINELMEGLKEKFPKYRITLNFEKTKITIDWS